MSDEQAMEIIENLSEELGEKELKIMALEKALEEQTKLLKQMTELCEIREWAFDYNEFWRDDTDPGDAWNPADIIAENVRIDGEGYELMIKVILHYFGGSIMNKDDIIEKYGDIDFDSELDFAIPGVDIEDLDNGKYWISDTL